ncbi:MAG: methyltransferase domain-containing protein [Acidobacteria bacterium]|nr:methyltransferase domain-containing protein [Acidobacteriota bacterium]MYJ05283.1 methyltransferase domain-containing protein [Acidobacteriota bacterium]
MPLVSRPRAAVAALLVAAAAGAVVLYGANHAGRTAQDPPAVGQDGKDVEWVPTAEALIETMLDMAALGPDDVLMDLGSGDGRLVIEAARRGARAIGVEYDARLVALSRERAADAGLSGQVTFLQADLFQIDLTEATVITLFLLPDLNLRLRPTLLDLAPGTRIVSNTWDMGDWTADETIQLDPCPGFCTALLWVVPARIAGAWTTEDGEDTFRFDQQFQVATGTLRRQNGNPLTLDDVALTGDVLTFRAGDALYRGVADGDTITGTATTGGRQAVWTVTRAGR